MEIYSRFKSLVSIVRYLEFTMNDYQDEKLELPQPFLGVLNIESIDTDDDEEKQDPAASTKNPNYKDNRRLFQEKRHNLDWDCSIPLEQQPNLVDLYGPEPLQ